MKVFRGTLQKLWAILFRPLLICDLDKIAIDCEQRFARAESECAKNSPEYWQAALDPQRLLELDQPIPEAVRLLRQLAGLCEVWYLTSRPLECRANTIIFLARHGYPCPGHVICRPHRKGLTTPLFKKRAVFGIASGLAPALAHRYFLATRPLAGRLTSPLRRLSAKQRRMYFVDDSTKNRQAVAELELPNLTIAEALSGEVFREVLHV